MPEHKRQQPHCFFLVGVKGRLLHTRLCIRNQRQSVWAVAGFKTTLVFFFLNKNYFSEKCNLHWMLEEVYGQARNRITGLDMCVNTDISTLVKSAISTQCLKKSLDQAR